MKTDALARQYGPTMYDLEVGLLEAFEKIEEAQADGIEPDAETLALIQASLDGALTKRDRCAQFLLHLESVGTAIGSEIGRLKDKKQRIEAARERFESYILAVMESVGTTKLEGEAFTFKMKQNPSSVIVDDPAAVPSEFMILPPAHPALLAIKKAIKNGRDVPGAHLQDGKMRLEVS